LVGSCAGDGSGRLGAAGGRGSNDGGTTAGPWPALPTRRTAGARVHVHMGMCARRALHVLLACQRPAPAPRLPQWDGPADGDDLGDDDDDDDDDGDGDEGEDDESSNKILCLVDRVGGAARTRVVGGVRSHTHSVGQVNRHRGRWRLTLRQGIIEVDGRDAVFHHANADLDFEG
jgi:hypothetical protein